MKSNFAKKFTKTAQNAEFFLNFQRKIHKFSVQMLNFAKKIHANSSSQTENTNFQGRSVFKFEVKVEILLTKIL